MFRHDRLENAAEAFTNEGFERCRFSGVVKARLPVR